MVQRPASVIKELVENSVDAGATEINIVLKDGGRTFIQVIDNGKGMSHNDARMAFERHATSKIATAQDLSTLCTMGFRGEALASICAVAQVELKTCLKGQSLGTRVVYSGGEKEIQELAVCAQGTNIMVRNLFFNIPARRRFMKSEAVELAAIMREFERLALVNNHIHMSIDTGSRIIDLRPGTFKVRICDIWKRGLDPHLIPIEVDTSLVKISGYISRPEHARRRNALQFLITNGRNMYHPVFRKVIYECFKPMIAPDTQPCYFLKFTVQPDTIDVNISPTKSEIKFEQEAEVRQILIAAIKASLGKYGAVPSIDFSQDALQLDPAREGDFVKAPTIAIDRSYNPFKTTPAHNTATDTRNWESLYAGFMAQTPSETPATSATRMSEPALPLSAVAPDSSDTLPPLAVQCALKYIITPDENGILIIDQYRAHLKILYERYMKLSGGADNTPASQRVMFGETIDLDPSQAALLTDVLDELSHLGFSLEINSDHQLKITGVPATLSSSCARDALLSIIDSISEDEQVCDPGSHPTPQMLRRRVALITARASAIKRGTRLSAADMEHIIGELFALPDPSRTPDGNPIFIRMPLNNIEGLFS